MTRSYRKNTLRTFKSTASRFAAVFAIVALGVGFLAGLNATPIDMKESMERYMDDGNFYDLRRWRAFARCSRDTRQICWWRWTVTPSSAASTACLRRRITPSTS